jgi:heat-inducible transcriptional repressor
MFDLTDRQTHILRSIVEEYIKTATPVGSETLEKKYNVGVSPATLLNEMVRLEEKGYLQKLHSSAGRIPTPKGLKLYVRELMKEQELPISEEVAMKEKIWDYRNEYHKLLKEATRHLAGRTHTLALAVTAEGDLFASGASYILDMPEFYDIDVTRNFLALLDQVEYFQKLLEQVVEDQDIHVLIGEELGISSLNSCGFVFSRFNVGSATTGFIGILGPARLNYPYVIPTVRTFSDLIEEVVKTW